MIARGQGKIINIASVQSELARPGIAPYTATKGAVRNLTRGMCADWAKYGLQINAIAPGYFKTPLNQALVDNPSSRLAREEDAGRTLGQCRGAGGCCRFPVGPRLVVYQRAHALCRRRHHDLPLIETRPWASSKGIASGHCRHGRQRLRQILGWRASRRSKRHAVSGGRPTPPRWKCRENGAGHTAC